MKSRATGSIIALALAALGTLVLLCFRSASVELVYPAEHARRCFSDRVWARVTGFFHGSAMGAENVRLRREVAALSLLKADVDRLETENARLRRALDYTARNPEVWLAAGVLSENGGASCVRNSIRVDRGSLAGVRVGAVVAVPDGLVGRVSAVSPHTSEITLITDPSLKVACKIVGADGEVWAHGILSGGGEAMLVLRYLRFVAESIPPRSRVLTSGYGGIFPHGLAVGTFLGFHEDSKGLDREGEVLPQVDYSTLEDVFIRRER